MKVKKLLGYFLILLLIVSNVFNYSTFANYKTEFNIITETIMAEDKEIKHGQVIISHLDIDTEEKLMEDEVLSKVVDTEIFGAELKKDIKDYTFKEAVPEKLIVAPENNEIKLYYKKDKNIPEEKYVDVTVHHYLIDSTEKVAEDQVIKEVKVGTVLISKDYEKQIDKYGFVSAVPETLKVSEQDKEIVLYYKNIEVPPVEHIDVQVYYYDVKDQEIAKPTVIKEVKIGTKLKGRDYLNDIEGYDFEHAFPEILEVREDNHVLKLYYKEKQVEPPAEFVNITVNYLLTGTDTKIAESNILENIKAGESLISAAYKLDIKGYIFEKAEFETIESGKGSDVINLYYKKVDDEKPEPPSPDNGGKEEPDLPQTGEMRDCLWCGYVLILMGIILRVYKKEEGIN